ncbi:MAG: ABC transporter ATP-binding protein/permease [Anaeroplasmataceae bacterium]|nr:ABC transporter ATP-binding protein/permease [Anaeroplasmataceae bacterium]MDE6414273.1 ABC transporter ATP-binding protein/permease [Anaeroplasmataceae bacterium]
MIKILMKSIREYKKASILTPLFVALEVVMECLIPLLMSYILGRAQEDAPDTTLIIILSLVIVVLGFFSLTFGVLSGKFGAIAAAGFAKNLRRDLFFKSQDFSFENIDRFSSASLVTRMTTDVSYIQMAYGMIIRITVRVPLMMIFSIVLTFVMSVKIGLIYLSIIPLLGIILFIIVKCAMPRFDRVFHKYDKLNASVEENIKGIRVVKTYVREDYEKDKFKKSAEEVRRDFVKAERIVAWNQPVMMFFMYVSLTVVSFFSAYLIVTTNSTELGIENVSAVITYGTQILMSLMMLSMIFVMISLSISSMRRVVEVLKEESTIQNPENPIYEVEDGSIEFKDVSFKYSLDAEKFALADVNIRIKSGETIGILGGTGSSKTTFVNLLSRLYDTTVGEVIVGGKNVKEYDLKALRDNVAVVLQKNVLFSGTILENLRWGNENATLEEAKEACRLACADEFIEQFPEKYDTYIEQGGTNVSGGQKQRLCIARALLKKPKVLILDDSTSAVDTKTDAIIRKSFKESIPNTTKIIIAQRVSSIEDADKIIVLDGGRIHAVGTHDELLASNTIYQEVYNLQNKKEEE